MKLDRIAVHWWRGTVQLVAALVVAELISPAAGQSTQGTTNPPLTGEGLPANYSCTECHKPGSDFLPPDSEELVVSVESLADDVHWKAGLRCHDCHGGNPVFDEFVPHRNDPSYHRMESPKDIPTFCGRCHSDLDYMRRYSPSARTDQEAEYWTSGHGKRLKEAGDEKVATCVSCHGHHGILAVDDLKSPVYPTHLAETCATCHADADLMQSRTYRDRPLGHEQFTQWKQSVHGRALLEQGDLSAPTCNDCHGNHGALPPEVGSVANACGTCHTKVSELFAGTQMKHRFEAEGLPGCATCHGSHLISSPSDAMLGMQGGAVCVECHQQNRYGATLAGAGVANTMSEKLSRLKSELERAEETIAQAERLGMEVRGPRFDLRQGYDALTNARSLIHTFAVDPVNEAIDAGLEVASGVQQRADGALQEHTGRRRWLALSLIPIAAVIVLLLLYIRSMPPPVPAR